MILSPEFLFNGVLGFVAALLAGPLSIRLAHHFNLVDIPKSSAHKQHARPTPLAGGTALFIALLILTFLSGLWRDETVRTILLGSLVIYLFGMWDDSSGLSAFPKLVGQLLATGILITNGLSVQFFSSLGNTFLSPSLTAWANVGITLFWLIGITNAMNMIDSMDGLVTGLGIITFLFFLVATQASGQENLALLSIIMLGICIALYLYNISPAQLFLGDSGAQTLGFIVAALAMVYIPVKLNPLSTWFVPIMLLMLPIFDTTLVVVSRLRRGDAFYKASLDHSYHRLVLLGVSPSRAVFTLHLAAAFLGVLAFIFMLLPPLIANIFFFIILAFEATLIVFAQRIRG